MVFHWVRQLVYRGVEIKVIEEAELIHDFNRRTNMWPRGFTNDSIAVHGLKRDSFFMEVSEKPPLFTANTRAQAMEFFWGRTFAREASLRSSEDGAMMKWNNGGAGWGNGVLDLGVKE
jgi:hypothetical protein